MGKLSHPKRLGLFIFYDRDGIVDDYVEYLLNDLCANFDHLTIFSNSFLEPSEKAKLEKFSKDIVMRENKGLDAGAFYEYFTTFDTYKEYDEIICFNDTFFGPFYSFKQVFDCMDDRDIDFWGLALGHRQRDGYGIMPEGYISEHIQTFFIAFRHNVLVSEAFQNYWKNYDYEHMQTFYDVVTKHELRFTQYLAQAGFRYDSYIKDTNASANYMENYNNYNYNAATQIIQDKALYIKRKNFAFAKKDFLYLTDQDDLRRALEYIKNETEYDVRMIWKNILRLYSLSDIHESLGLYSIVSEQPCPLNRNVIFVVYIDNVLMMKDLASKIFEIQGDWQVFTANEQVYDFLKEKCSITKIKKNEFSRRFVSFLTKVKQEYVGFFFIHEHVENCITIIEESVYKKYLKCIVNSQSYINNVLKFFDKDSSLGVSYALNSLHYDYYYKSNHWDHDVYLKLKELLPNNTKLVEEKLPISFAQAWIVRGDVLKCIDFTDWHFEEDELFAKCLSIGLSFVAADNGYYSNLILNEKEALNQLNLYRCIYQNTSRILQRLPGVPLTLSGEVEFIKNIKIKSSKSFIRRGFRYIKRLVKKMLHKK